MRGPEKCRPDWNFEAPEMKAAWARGDKQLPSPHDKTYPQGLGEQC
jgi:hypothetical protein